MSDDNDAPYYWHRKLEGNLGLFAVLTTIVILIGALVEIIPMFTVSAGPQALAGVTPYTPLEQAGRDIYVREGCYTCHSQMVRPTRRAPGSSSTSIRSSSARAAWARTCTALAASTPTRGTTSTCGTRAPPRRGA